MGFVNVKPESVVSVFCEFSFLLPLSALRRLAGFFTAIFSLVNENLLDRTS